MLREKLMRKPETGFRWRGHEIARIEGLSDAVFAFAVTLLVVSLEVPKTFNELMGLIRGFGAFAICFALLLQVWHEQYLFFRRYFLQDGITIVLNCILLFVALFYVYPLKFLFTLLVNEWSGAGASVRTAGGVVEQMIEPGQLSSLMAIFSWGYLSVSCVFLALFGRALAKRAELDLNPLEIFETKVSIAAAGLNGAVGLISLAMALSGGGGLAGVIYPILIGPGFTILYTFAGRRKRRFAQ